MKYSKGKPRLQTLLRFKIGHCIRRIRVIYYRSLGLHTGSGCSIGRISCEWPNKITTGRDCIIQNDVHFSFGQPFEVKNCLLLGERVFIGRQCEFNISTSVSIGSDTMIASNTTFVDIAHGMAPGTSMNLQPTVTDTIVVEDDVWIGTGCIILKGVIIGKGSVIGAGSVVTRSIPQNQIWAGRPAHFIRNK